MALAVLLSACDKENTSKQEVNKTISKNDTLKYDLGGFGDEEGASIQQQAAHFETSELARASHVTYYYKAEAGFTGQDYVELRSARGSDGASPNTDIVITKLSITVQ